jgi:GNAT superfamily N-acetyltransferase
MANFTHGDFHVRDWQPADRQAAADVIRTVLAEYGLGWEPTGADRDVLEVESAYQQAGGEFWVVEQAGQIVGTAAYYPIGRSPNAVEIRKMYLQRSVRGQGLGRFLLTQLEGAQFGLRRPRCCGKRCNCTHDRATNRPPAWKPIAVIWSIASRSCRKFRIRTQGDAQTSEFLTR